MKHYSPFSFRVWKLLIACIMFLSLAGCLSWFMPDSTPQDRIEVGLYNSLKSAEEAYKDLSAYAQDHSYLFSEEQKALINDVSDAYTQAMITALASWITYKTYDNQEDLASFIEHATIALREIRALHNLIMKNGEVV